MDHPSKRRRIMRRVEDPTTTDCQQDAGRSRGVWDFLFEKVLPQRQRLSLPSLADSAPHVKSPLSLALPSVGTPHVLELQNPTQNQAPDPASEIIPQADVTASLRTSVIRNGKVSTSDAVNSGTKGLAVVKRWESVNPNQSAPDVNKDQPSNTNDTPVMKAATATSDEFSQRVEELPGRVTPSAADAARNARTQALQSQEAVAQESFHPKEPASAAAAAAAPAPPAAAMQTPQSVPSIDRTSQKPLGTPPTPLPSPDSIPSYFPNSPASVSASPQHDSSEQRTGSGPPTRSDAPNMPHDVQQPSSHNSTASASVLSGTGSSIPASMISSAAATSDSLLAAISASEASASRHAAKTASSSSMLSPSMLAALSRSRNSISPSSAPSTFVTMTSSSSEHLTSFTAASSASSLSSSQTASSSSSSASDGFGAGGIGSPSNTASSQSPSSTSATSSSGSAPPPTPVLVGGIVGGVAGLVMILLALLFLLRWRRRTTAPRRLISPPMTQAPLGAGAGAGQGQSGTITQRSSSVPIAAAGFFGRMRPSSSQTADTSDTAPSERGFQKLSGRKLESVLQSGGDGYGNSPSGTSSGPSTARGIAASQGLSAGLAPGLRPTSPHSLSGSSFYRDSRGFYGGVVPKDELASDPTDRSSSLNSSSPPNFPAPPTGASRSPHGPNRASEVANMRPGPARQPIINRPGALPVRNPSRLQAPPPRPARATPPPLVHPPPDGVGRSLPNQDGSRGSRFTEATTPP